MTAFEKYQQEVSDVADAKSHLVEAGRAKALPKEIREKIRAIVNEVDSYKPKAPPLTVPTGDVMTVDEFLAAVQDATGYLWKRMPDREVMDGFEGDSDPREYAASMGLDVDPANAAYYGLFRDARSRDELYMLLAFAVPGRVHLLWYTDRVAGDQLVPNDEVKEALSV